MKKANAHRAAALALLALTLPRLAFSGWVAPDADTHKRANAMPMMALAMGKRINVNNHKNDSCTAAAYVEVGGGLAAGRVHDS